MLRRKGRFLEAIPCFRTAVELDPRDPNLHYNLAQTYSLLRDYRRAEPLYVSGLALAPDYLDGYWDRALLHLAWRGDTEVARRALMAAPRTLQQMVLYALNTNTPEYCTVLRCLDDVGEQLLAAGLGPPVPGDSNNLFWLRYFLALGELQARRQEPSEAASSYSSVRRLASGLAGASPSPVSAAEVHSCLGMALAGLGMKEEAIAAGLRAASLLPDSRDAMLGPSIAVHLAVIYAMVGQYEAALDRIEHLLSIPGYLSARILSIDPIWTPMRGYPRFERLLSERAEGQTDARSSDPSAGA